MAGYIGNRLSYGPHVLIIFFLAMAAFVLLILITFSAPFIASIYFLSNNSVQYGAFGWCSPDFCSKSKEGYEFGTQVLSPLTAPMILWGLACAFCLFTWLSIVPLLWVHDNQALHAVANATFFKYNSLLTALLVSVVWPITISGWSVVRREFRLTTPNSNATLGNATWLGLAATILVWLLIFIGWPVDATGGRPDEGYYHYRQTVREVQRPRV